MTQTYDVESIICSIHFCALANSYQERNFILRSLEAAGIETRPFTSGHQGQHPYWFRDYGEKEKKELFMADKLYHKGFFLPNHPYLNKEDIEFICSTAIKTSLEFRKGEKNNV